MKIIGWDIGGANIKATSIEIKDEKAFRIKTITHYYPIWVKGKERLPIILNELKKEIAEDSFIDAIGLTMTAELSDVYETKKEGVKNVLDCIKEVFPKEQIFVLDVDARLKNVEEAREEYLKVAGANWVGTAWMVSKWVKDCILLDVGSTTTDIIPIIKGRIMARGKTDLERLANGELIYTGVLRTNVATIVEAVPVKGIMTRVSSELFALSGDVHLILGNISQDEYTSETADKRGKTRKEALSRLVRVVCADTDMLKEDEIVSIANYVYRKQLDKISDGVIQVYSSIRASVKDKLSLVLTGIGRNFLGRKSSEKLRFESIIDLAQIIGKDASIATPSLAVALMLAYERGVRETEWSL
ncbi:MAG: H4MPT-linked C1 transfer pathway protein [archaeon]|nr:H4MPT-linked C1 transfer pathway protein [archaeon]MCP8314455.1 H4MPT-linked C1 transfer pathway protein [archaeon]MCP8317530.1 H4MPT-linked C1 transfer pathway protein [archaeon]MCP8319986.1 H4MPT-linked C1 transfer pathway protein [archaeon]